MLSALSSPVDNAIIARLRAAEQHGPGPGRLAALLGLVADAMALCEARLPDILGSGGPADVRAAALHLLSAGGKRVRPLLLALSARACRPESPPRLPPLAALMAAAELTHTATLLHDDVIDVSAVRRGLPTARMRWGNAVSVLAGDYVLTRALEEVEQAAVPGAMPALLSTIRAMIAGEALQLSLRGRADVQIRDYEQVVDGKTAALFAFCGRAGALAVGTAEHGAVLADYAGHLGRAFQIVDDVLDIDGDPEAIGKSVLSDVHEGKLTLPVLMALEARPSLREPLRGAALRDDGMPEPLLNRLRDALADSDAPRRARAVAAAEAEEGCALLHRLPSSPYRDALWLVADELVQRNR
ncbi:MAG: polyprenyl synthetase family protein [Polyangia bacterium]